MMSDSTTMGANAILNTKAEPGAANTTFWGLLLARNRYKSGFSQITSNQLDTTRDTKYNMNGGDNPMSKWKKQSKESCPYPRTYDSMNCVRY